MVYWECRGIMRNFIWPVDSSQSVHSTPTWGFFRVWLKSKAIQGFYVLQHRFRRSTSRGHFWRMGKIFLRWPHRLRRVSTLRPRSWYSNRGGNLRNLTLTEAEETALVNLFLFVHDLGVPPHLEEDEAFDTLWEKVSEPSPFDYSWILCHFSSTCNCTNTISQTVGFLKRVMMKWEAKD